MGLGNSGRVASLSSILSPAAGTKNDADGTAVVPVLETGLFRGYSHIRRRWVMSFGLQQWKNFYLNYDMRDAATDNPVLSVSYATDPSASSYTSITRTYAKTTKNTRGKRNLGFRASGLMLKIVQTNASSDTRLGTMEAEYDPLEGSALMQ